MAQTEKTAQDNSEEKQTLPLFYRKPQPLDSEKHKALGLVEGFDLGFTSGVNAVPINLIEMPQVAQFYPVGFSPDERATPVAVLGVRDNENLFLNEDGTWIERTYIPAYIRRYPFIFSETPGTDQLALCADMDEGAVTEGSAQKFFDDEGKPSELSQNALNFCKSYHAAAQQTQEFSQKLASLDILVDRQAEIAGPDNQKISFSGFRAIDEEKFKALSDEVFLDLRKNGYLKGIYAHLASDHNWGQLSALLQKRS